MMYLIDNTLELTREELIQFTVDFIYDNELEGSLRNLLPNYTVEENVRHHAVRILREIGFEVASYHK